LLTNRLPKASGFTERSGTEWARLRPVLVLVGCRKIKTRLRCASRQKIKKAKMVIWISTGRLQDWMYARHLN
jgi:hypothetical protein